jgi:CO/xanthine dehydrogenase FAD-binding subunit
VVSSDDIAAVISPIDDTRGTANYRIQAASVLVMEAIDNCLDQIRASA